MALGFLKFFKGMVGSALSQITNQARFLEDAVTEPIRGFVKEVTGGIWRGDGATRFATEMTSEVIPQLVNMFNAFDVFGGAVKKSMDILERAEREATSKANMLNDVFHKIF